MRCLLCGEKTIVEESYKKEHFIEMWKPFYDVSSIFQENHIDKYTCVSCSLVFFDPKYSGSNEFYSKLGQLDWYYNHSGKTEFQYCQRYVKDGDQLLDIGCGIGVLKSELSDKIDYTGIELSSGAHKIAASKNINVFNELIQDYSKLHLEQYDCVVSFQVLEHLNEINSFVSSAISCIKPGGYFIVAVPNNDAFIKNVPNNKFNLPPHHMIHWRENQLRLLGKLHGLKIIDVHKEKIQKIHLQEARVSAIYEIICLFRNKKVKLVDYTNWQFKITSKIHFFTKFIPPFLIDLFLKHRYKYGQSIMVTFQK